MPREISKSLSATNICRILEKNGIISVKQVREILDKKDSVRKVLEQQRKKRKSASSGITIENPITIVDIINSFNLQRADKNSGIVDEDTIFRVISREWDVTYKKIDPLKLDLNLVTTTIPRSFAMKHLVIPIAVKDGFLTVATSDPFNDEVIADVGRVTHLKINVVVSSKTDIIKLIDEFFGFKRSIQAAEKDFNSTAVDLGNLEQFVSLKSADELPSDDQHIVNAVNHLFNYAIDQNASDIHIEPKRDISLVRMRIDGILHSVYKLPKKVHLAITSRIKNISRMDISEKRRPQDGRIKLNKGDTEVEIRTSTIPIAFGEKTVMRILDPDILFQDLTKLGFSKNDLKRFDSFTTKPHGLIIVCGPTGSGKSTTLYSTLRNLSTPEINITTVEDPIEMIHEEFNQIAVQPAVDVTFSTILRNILRQDPDVIMIGEMRDLDTAENAIQAAMTGHLVLSTLHTNDAPSTITRLLDLGVPPFLIKANLIGILAQRLVRKICKNCAEAFSIDSNKLRSFGLKIEKTGNLKLARGKGCVKCRGTGYRGRSGIYEVLPYTDNLKQLTTSHIDIDSIRNRAIDDGMVSMRQNAIRKLLMGETTYQEILRVTWAQD